MTNNYYSREGRTLRPVIPASARPFVPSFPRGSPSSHHSRKGAPFHAVIPAKAEPFVPSFPRRRDPSSVTPARARPFVPSFPRRQKTSSRHSRVGGNLRPSFPRRRESILEYLVVQIAPIRVHLLDQSYFPKPIPFFDLLLTNNRRLGVLMQFVPHQPPQTILSGKACDEFFSMLRDTLRKIRRYSDIERASGPIGQYVDAKLFCHQNGFPPSRE